MKLSEVLNKPNKVLLPLKDKHSREVYNDDSLKKYKNTGTIISTKSNGIELRDKSNTLNYVFGTIHGNFLCIACGLTSLKGSPKKMTDGGFFCQSNKLATLEGCTQIIPNDFCCDGNNLTNLKGGPIESQSYYCSGSNLSSLEGAPSKVDNNFICHSNMISSFENCPRYIGNWFNIEANKITSLKNIHKHLEHCKRLTLNSNKISEGGLGLLLINGLEIVEYGQRNNFSKALKIIGKYFGQGKKGLLACQEELIEAKLERFAQL